MEKRNDARLRPVWAYVLGIALSEAVGGLSALLTRDGMELYRVAVEKPPLSPPSIVFPIVWTILYAFMGVSAARVYLAPDSAERRRGIALFLVQLAMNFFWSILFFEWEAFGGAFLWLAAMWAVILWMTLTFRKVDAPAAYLQIPYLVWVLFAGYLNLGAWLLNR